MHCDVGKGMHHVKIERALRPYFARAARRGRMRERGQHCTMYSALPRSYPSPIMTEVDRLLQCETNDDFDAIRYRGGVVCRRSTVNS